MCKDFTDLLPNPDDKEKSKISPENVLLRLSKSINDRYNKRILGVVASAPVSNEELREVLNYTFYLQFTRQSDYTYPLLTAECIESNGSYPMKVKSHYGPPNDHGVVTTEAEFESAIKDILIEEKTRIIILSMY
jgi:hypothetical protein